MKKSYKWRWILVIVIVMITLIGSIITFVFPIAILIAIGIDELVSQVFRLIVVPKLKEIEEKEKEREKESKKYDPVKKITKLLENYENIINDDIIEVKYTKEILKLFPELELIGFGKEDDMTFADERYKIHLTTTSKKQFYIKNLVSGKLYYSKKYDQERKIIVLNEFYAYLKTTLNNWSNSTE